MPIGQWLIDTNANLNVIGDLRTIKFLLVDGPLMKVTWQQSCLALEFRGNSMKVYILTNNFQQYLPPPPLIINIL